MEKQQDNRYPNNAPGEFYVVNGECSCCGFSEVMAPDLIEYENGVHCYFKKQPSTDAEMEQAAIAVWACCCGALKYSGNNPIALRTIAKLDEEAKQRIQQQEEKERKEAWWKFWRR